jgi:hypothetical protein
MIASGTGVKSFLDEDIAFQAVPAQPQVIQLPAMQSASLTK